MRWPFMLVSTHEARVVEVRGQTATDWQAVANYWMGVAKEARSTHDAYVATIAERTIPPAKPVVTPAQPKVKDSADIAIETASAFDPRRRRHLDQWVRARRAEGMSAEDIAQEVLHPPATGYGEWVEE